METQEWSAEDIAQAICRSYTGEIHDETLEVRVSEHAEYIGHIATGTAYAA